MKILVISLAGIGDTLLATPLIHELRAGFPDAQVDALVLWAGSKDLLAGNPHLNSVYQQNLLKQNKVESLRFFRQLRKQRYDVSINTHPQSRIHYRVIARLIGARLRISHVYECFGFLDKFLVNRTLAQDYQKHTVENNLDVLPLLGAGPVLPHHELEVFLSPAEGVWADDFLTGNGLRERKLLGVHVGSGGTKNLKFKRWPLRHYLALFRALKDSQPDVSILLFGGPEEEEDLQRILAETGPPFAVRAVTQDLRQAAALIKKCAVFLSVDTALMHLAAAVRVPRQIVIEAPTLNRTNEPYGNAYTRVKNPAVGGRNLEFYRYDGRGIQGTPEQLRRCMASIGSMDVLKALVQALES
jgi:lipopolysaccharide heptosyltransferase II